MEHFRSFNLNGLHWNLWRRYNSFLPSLTCLYLLKTWEKLQEVYRNEIGTNGQERSSKRLTFFLLVSHCYMKLVCQYYSSSFLLLVGWPEWMDDIIHKEGSTESAGLYKKYEAMLPTDGNWCMYCISTSFLYLLDFSCNRVFIVLK